MNSFIGRKVAELKWPFFRYDVLMAEYLPSDLFVWLYISIVVLKNHETKKEKNSYAISEIEQSKKLLMERFNSIIDNTILERIVLNAERNFVSSSENSIGFVSNTIKDEAFEFLSTFGRILSEKVEIRRVFKDGITGEVVPFFGNSETIENWGGELKALNPLSKKRPNKLQIIKAFEIYRKNKNNNLLSYPIQDEVGLLNNTNNELESQNQKPTKTNNIILSTQIENSKFNPIYLENSECMFHLKVEVYVKDNKFLVTTPFEKNFTQLWFSKQFELALRSGQSNELSTLINDLEKVHIVQEIKSETESFPRRISQQLHVCGTLYKLIENTKNNDLKKIIFSLDDLFLSNSDYYFSMIGIFLECLISPLKEKPNSLNRNSYDYRLFCKEIEAWTQKLKIDGKKLLNDELHRNWQKGSQNFKADLANLFFNHKLSNSKFLYFDFINDAFSLFNIRNKYGGIGGTHYRKNSISEFNNDQIKKLEKVTMVIIDLYEG